MMKLTKEMRTAKKLINKQGVKVIDISRKGKHPKFTISDGTKTIKMTIAATSSCHRAQKNMIAFVRREFADSK